MKQYQSFKCNKCGNIVELQKVGGGTLSCCGEAMEMVTENLTLVNLMKAFAGESMARNKYEFFSKVAREENLVVVAEHFQKSADNEKIHAKLLLKAYNKILYSKELGSTLENLDIAIGGENYEHTTMYPEFSTIAKDEGFKDIAVMFDLIGKVEIEHERDYILIKEAITKDKLFKSDIEEEWTCQVCGHIHRSKNAPAKCPICKHSQDHFKPRNSFMK